MFQTNTNHLVAFEVQAGLGTPASGAGAFGVRLAEGSAGGQLTKSIIESREIRSDGQRSRGRHGSRRSAGTFQFQLSEGELDSLIEAMLRGTTVAAIAITQATMTSITTTTSTIVAAAGSWLTQGVRRGDLVKLANHSTVANNGKWFRVLSVTASTITVPTGDLVLDAVADTSFTLTVAKSVINGTTPVERYFTVEERWADLDFSFVWKDQKVTRLEVSIQPGQTIICTITFTGLDVTLESGATSPYFTTPTFTTSNPLVMADGKVRLLSSDRGTELTGLTLTLEIPADVPETLSTTAPDVFLGNMAFTGQLSALVQDSTFFNAFLNETQIELFVHAMDGTVADPKPSASFYIGNAVLDGHQGSPAGNGPKIITVPIRAGIDLGGTDRAQTTVKYSSSAP